PLVLVLAAVLFSGTAYAEELSFDKGIFAQGGEGKTTVVVGINTHGIVPEDLKCANTIAEKIREAGTEEVAVEDGIELEIKWLTEDFAGLAWSDINESDYYKKSTSGKAEFKYSHLYFTEKSRDLKLRPCYKKTSAEKGEIFTVRYYDYKEKTMKSRYYGIVELVAGEKIAVGEVSKRTLNNGTNPENFIAVPHTSKSIGVSDVTANVSIGLKVYDRDNRAIDGTFAISYNQSELPKLIEDKEFTDLFPDYYIILETVDAGTGSATIALVNRSEVIELRDGMEDTAGYEFIKVFNDDYGVANGFAAFGPEVTVSPGERVKISGTKYWVSLAEDKTFDIEKESTVDEILPETWLKKANADYDDFLTKDIRIAVSSSYDAVPQVPVKSEDEVTDTEKEGNTLVLVGGPVANSLVAELVKAGKSKVDWYASEGDVEVIEDAFAEGQTAIIVAGKDREATANATEMFTSAAFTSEEVTSGGWGS
ncbi:MAG: S-layer protein, partial [Euryarchaeota archaeon]|nr:S-layer protein [Euryarchaeota archaeon]